MGKAILIFLVVLVSVTALGYGMKWFKVFETETVGKAQQDAERHVYESSESYVLGKRQELSKLRHEYKMALANNNTAAADAILSTTRLTFAEFNADHLTPELKDFLNTARY